uniref:Uncharacterized protein n=1 Tax=Anguilla anguilla TaxID=7936 RepID=A0A0E9S375_ANGAN
MFFFVLKISHFFLIFSTKKVSEMCNGDYERKGSDGE